MNMKTCPLLALTLALVLVAGCGARPEIRAIRPRVTDIDLRGVDLAFDVDVHNPYPVALRTPRFRYGLDIEERAFLDSEADVKVDLPAGRVGTATLPVRLEYAALWRMYTALANAAEVDYRLQGKFLLSALGQTFELPLAHSGAFPILRAPSFRVTDVDVSDVSFSQARVTLAAEIHNPNVFDIDARALGYELRLGDAEVGDITASTLGSVPAGASGQLTLTGQITARSALTQLLRGASLGDARLTPAGSIKTPYGVVDLAP